MDDDNKPTVNRQPLVTGALDHWTCARSNFDFYYNPGFATYEEPEGLTIWDLDDGRASGIRGQLHAFVSENDLDLGDSGDVDVKHYTRVIRVDCGSTGACQTGTAACPFKALSPAVSFAWPGADVKAQAGSYGETLRISKRIRLSTEGGIVRLGG